MNWLSSLFSSQRPLSIPPACLTDAERQPGKETKTWWNLSPVSAQPHHQFRENAAVFSTSHPCSAPVLNDVRSRLLPADKATAVHQLEQDGHRVLLIGDGVNDAPALAAATTGIAMGRHGSDLALDTADAIIVRDELEALPSLIAMSKRAHRYVVANLAIAATFITVLVTWDLISTLPLPLAVAGHEGSTVIVALNGLRLLRSQAWKN
ncbi:HAD family hydrolase [Arthrobacter sp. B1805]|uniref:HAD family hydrolase n=1 Tax=Arthrobacter sp. B1805 TaxID=2058892 RepID=UPI0021588AEC|nr:HAD family hydrolase [Arthrobacter sp. B1805]